MLPLLYHIHIASTYTYTHHRTLPYNMEAPSQHAFRQEMLYTCICIPIYIYAYTHTHTHWEHMCNELLLHQCSHSSNVTTFVCENVLSHNSMGCLRLVGSLKLQVSFGKETHKRDDILQKRPMISRSLLTVATPYLCV